MHPTRTLTFCCLALIALAALSKQAFASSSATVGLCAGPWNPLHYHSSGGKCAWSHHS
jgi:hypothetical protein